MTSVNKRTQTIKYELMRSAQAAVAIRVAGGCPELVTDAKRLKAEHGRLIDEERAKWNER